MGLLEETNQAMRNVRNAVNCLREQKDKQQINYYTYRQIKLCLDNALSSLYEMAEKQSK